MSDQDPDYHINPNYQKSNLLPKVRPSTAGTPTSSGIKKPPTAVPATPRMLRNTSGHQILQAGTTPQRSSSTHRPSGYSTPSGPTSLNNDNTKQTQFHRRSIGEWDFMKTIGAGSMGKVKLARHRRTNEICAIKIIPRAARLYARNHANDPPPVDQKELEKRQKEYEKEIARDKRTIREASLGKILYHPFICRLFEVITMSNHYYMLFEYVSGGQMLDYIVSHGSLKERHARKFVRGIASALDYLHRNNVVHRDLKIENIMISNTGDIKIIDFGLSNFYSNDALLKTYCGSLYFAAPELLSAHPYIGPEVDVWSFGVVLYVLVCGKVPFDDQDVSVLHEKIKKGKVDYPDFLSNEVVSLLSRMLVVNPNKRAGLAEVMSHPWMTRGYEGPPTSFVPHRIPLTLPLDQATITEMANLEFGQNEDQIRNDITQVVSSKLYQDASENWYRNQRAEENVHGGQIDPTTGFHPLVSIYYLVEEMLKRKKAKQSIVDVPQAVKEQPKEITPDTAAGAPTQEKPKVKIETPSQPPVISFPEAAHTSPRATSPPGFPDRQQQLPSTSHATGNDDFLLTQQQKHPKSAAVTDEHSKGFNSILRKFSQRRAHSQRRPPPSHEPTPAVSSVEDPLYHSTGFNHNGNNGAVPMETTDNGVKYDPKHLMSPQQDALVRRVGSLKLTKKSPFDTPEKPTVTDNSLSAPTNKVNKSHNRTVSAYAGPAEALSSGDAKVAPGANASKLPATATKKFHPSARAKSVGHAARRHPSGFVPNEGSENSNALPPLPTDLNDDAFFDDVTLDDYSPTDKPSLVTSNTSSNQQGGARLGELANTELSETQILAEAARAPEGSMPSIEYPRSLFLKGFFSVQTTSTKPLPIIRANVISVLTKLGVKFTEVRGGFICVHTPSIEQPSQVPDVQITKPDDFAQEDQSLKSSKSSSGDSAANQNQETTRVHSLEHTFDQLSTPSSKGGHRRKFSIGGSILGSYRRKNGGSAPPIPPTPVAATRYDSSQMAASPSAGTSNQGASSSHTDYDSSASLDSLNAGEGGSDMLVSSRIEQNKARTPSTSGEKSQHQQQHASSQASKARTPLKFEIHIVKVPLVGLSGVHFKKVLGNTWMYKALAGQILSELNL
ncbi:hypothetical protein WICANDRAFT_25325 [Wickerhamomyces anomalus NRRL Y-366-8]|uniref:non-specific serine/threonine protein kinase n=1 Tax=Wickerhamomyces anomalus (strain ATCC 58044 / CBS 1984 / NCYC 433 / NRRL Y-366-8) TaxID=683960 RepID=A0A1E3PBY9_WICAA|nr:uncharacterized protein WICANDRAFT_25325 [Wickerhamomyces anomalus NRRL Y-366-8]ODQ62734.1 hypothetical protein WICANDRAFT_25325 [Wickerhamomyces anomalus NRRL Y-366-8]